eukprot:scaffold266066_cov19-Prasinocladus_malaysianus.AAC.1
MIGSLLSRATDASLARLIDVATVHPWRYTSHMSSHAGCMPSLALVFLGLLRSLCRQTVNNGSYTEAAAGKKWKPKMVTDTQ